jgi:hypothetical protein
MPKLCRINIENRQEIYARIEKFIEKLKKNFQFTLYTFTAHLQKTRYMKVVT